jgi:hypothetical protein
VPSSHPVLIMAAAETHRRPGPRAIVRGRVVSDKWIACHRVDRRRPFQLLIAALGCGQLTSPCQVLGQARDAICSAGRLYAALTSQLESRPSHQLEGPARTSRVRKPNRPPMAGWRLKGCGYW